MSEDDATWVGRTLDRYSIQERLGSGGVARVYRATHTVIDKECAVKMLASGHGQKPQLLERLKLEAIAASKIRHPNIVAIEDFVSTEDGSAFIIMELVKGRTLARVIAEESPISPQRTASIMRQVFDGLAEAHRSGFVHRDLKPANIMLTAGPEGEEIVKILDFGTVLMKHAEPPPSDPGTTKPGPGSGRLTTVGQTLGTPTYMAPEQILNSSVEPSADLYAAGVVMYEMLSGQPPFQGDSMVEVLAQQMESVPAPIDAGGLESLVMRLLEKRPKNRPDGAEDVVEILDLFLTGPVNPDMTATQEMAPVRPTLQVDATLNPAAVESADLAPARLREDSVTHGLPPEIQTGALELEEIDPGATLRDGVAQMDPDTLEGSVPSPEPEEVDPSPSQVDEPMMYEPPLPRDVRKPSDDEEAPERPGVSSFDLLFRTR